MGKGRRSAFHRRFHRSPLSHCESARGGNASREALVQPTIATTPMEHETAPLTGVTAESTSTPTPRIPVLTFTDFDAELEADRLNLEQQAQVQQPASRRSLSIPRKAMSTSTASTREAVSTSDTSSLLASHLDRNTRNGSLSETYLNSEESLLQPALAIMYHNRPDSTALPTQHLSTWDTIERASQRLYEETANIYNVRTVSSGILPQPGRIIGEFAFDGASSSKPRDSCLESARALDPHSDAAHRRPAELQTTSPVMPIVSRATPEQVEKAKKKKKKRSEGAICCIICLVLIALVILSAIAAAIAVGVVKHKYQVLEQRCSNIALPVYQQNDTGYKIDHCDRYWAPKVLQKDKIKSACPTFLSDTCQRPHPSMLSDPLDELDCGVPNDKHHYKETFAQWTWSCNLTLSSSEDSVANVTRLF